jgi:RHS repeat-associated protein
VSGSIPDSETEFLYEGVQCVEERSNDDDPLRQYVWGTYVDELLQIRESLDEIPFDRYPLQDSLYRTVALASDTGAIAETYDYDPYGNTLIFNAAGTGGNWWADDATQTKQPTCDYLWTGRRYDPETEIYYFRARYYGPTLGRFLSEDPLGYVDGMNLYGGYFVPRGSDPRGTNICLMLDFKRATCMKRCDEMLKGNPGKDTGANQAFCAVMCEAFSRGGCDRLWSLCGKTKKRGLADLCYAFYTIICGGR